MISLAKLSIRRPKSALAIWLIVGVALSLIGFGVSKTLSPTITIVPGTESSRAESLAGARFGPTQLVPILLEGPRAQLDREGPPLVAALAKRPNTRVLSAWDTGTASAGLRPRPTAAMIVVSIDRSERDAVEYDAPQIEKLVSHRISAPVRSYITGQPVIDRAERSASLSNLRRNELIAVGILFLLLLVGLRAPVAALIVTAVGAVSALAGFGEVALLGRLYKIDPVDIAAGTMLALALGVAFSLLILDRFHREELPPRGEPQTTANAAMRELEGTGKAVLVAGTAIVLALLLVSIVGPTDLMNSVGTSALVCAMFATGGAVVVMPAALMLLGRRIDALRFPAPPGLARVWSGLVSGGNWVTRHAVYSGLAATAILAAIAVPAFALRSGPSDITQLPAHSQARLAFEEIARTMGPGWATPYTVVVASNNRPITTPTLLANIYRFERQIARNITVYSVTGPGQINAVSTQLKPFGRGIKQSVQLSDQSRKDLLKLANGLGQAGAGSAQLQAGLAAASSGAGQLRSGGGAAQTGAGQLHAGLAQAQAGSTKLQAGLNQALSGAVALKNGSAQVLSGTNQLVKGLGQAQTGAKPVVPALTGLASSAAITSSQVNGAMSPLQSMTAGKRDPRYTAALHALTAASSSAAGTKALSAVIASQAPGLVNGINRLHAGAALLQGGIEQLHSGNAALANGIGQLANGGGQLTAGLAQLTAGAGALQIGLGQLTNGAGQLATGLAGGVGPAGQLTTGLGMMQAAVVKSRGRIPSTAQLKQLEAQSPGIFNSGYFVLAAVEGATPSNRNAATFTINLLRGGTAGQIVVVSKYTTSDPRTSALGTALAHASRKFARANDVQVAVGGPAGNLGDLTAVTRSRIWVDVAVLTAAIVLLLGLALRALLLPVVATALSLLVVAASFGVMQLWFGGPDPPLGGPGYLDPLTIISVFTVAYGLSTVFSTVLLMRTREEYVAGSHEAVRSGLRKTAAAATGAGLLMIAALIPFSTTDFINIRALGIGVAVAVLLDVVIMRPVLLPAAEAVLGRFGWWPTVAPPRPSEPITPGPSRRHFRSRLAQRRPGHAHM